jgi:hypothetical protein
MGRMWTALKPWETKLLEPPGLVDHLKRQQFRYPKWQSVAGLRLKLIKGPVDLIVHNQLLSFWVGLGSSPNQLS